ncbi:methylated-DNA--[protein]-cysteine S-methyltransferase [Anaeromyxobacter oryzae]|uniref:Methylated-DNA--protein-cysteine methyltransferase n=1 Tax=Anaeromyxobacter oryzae TaxID=2918170 RepID=A0ABN6MRQ7_9BACT|nr:methylated-DNA--[protein]-cysteine S-methyltransferase [Anaeromyxobacter oryzae]BDG03166.1 methylated-DNA--protein-cysteine methyltransferase [Anaeromyxobacter oryzae]
MTRHALSMPSPLGTITLVANDDALVAVHLGDEAASSAVAAQAAPAHPVLERAREQLAEYLAGRRTAFELPLHLGGTDFQRAVWTALRAIPFGETRTYGELARTVGRPAAVRAVGAANGQNPLAIVVPCHRVIGADGTLTGYAGGLARKRWLLAHEAAPVPGPLFDRARR